MVIPPAHLPALVIDCPGAKMLTHLPILLKLAKASLSVLAPTVMEEGAEEGDMVQASAPRLLPAAVTTMMPAEAMDSTASFRLAARGPTRDMLMMADLKLLRVL